MPLFAGQHYRRLNTRAAAPITTPLGDLQLSFTTQPSVDRRLVASLLTCKRRFGHRHGSVITEWAFPFGLLETLEVRTVARCPVCWEEVDVEVPVQAILMRLLATEKTPPFETRVRWLPGYQWRQQYADSGEGLSAQCWEDENHAVCVGAEDSDALARRCHHDDWMPLRLGDFFATSEVTEATHDSLATVLPPLSQGERCQLRFVVAWGSPHEDLLLAVEPRADELLCLGNCLP